MNDAESRDFIAEGIQTDNWERWMGEAIAEADAAGQAGEIPIGAVLCIHGEVVARGRNRNGEYGSQIRHAELNALLNGGPALRDHFRDAILFTTVEPCPMCLGAAVMADVPHIVFAIHDRNVHSGHTVATNPYVRRHIRTYHGGVLADETAAVVARYQPELLRYIRRRAIEAAMALYTTRLTLRPHALSDLNTLCAMDTDEGARRFTGGVADRAATLAHLEKSIAAFGKGDWKFAIDDRETGEMLGWCWLKRDDRLGGFEIGYQIAREQWGRGIATEAAARLIRFAFQEAGLSVVNAVVDPANGASVRVLEKTGMRCLGERPWDCLSGRAWLFEMRRSPRRDGDTSAQNAGG